MIGGYRFNAVGAFILLTFCAFPSAKAQSLNYNNICLLINNGEMIATGNSCTNYYVCQNGVATLQSCQNGMYFSKDSQQCMPASSVNCFSANANPCSGATIGSFAPLYNSCSSYYYCGANGAVRGSCPNGENFNPTTQSCQYASQYPCGVVNNGDNGNGDSIDSGESSEITGVNLCTFMPNGIFFGSASSCSEWNLCTNNALSSGNCPTGFAFNPQINKCDYQSNVNCAQVTNDPNLINSPSIGGPCTQQGTKKPSSQCAGYYVCNGVSYQLFYCQNGMYYDTVSQTCTSRLNARNNCDRCQGTKDSFVNMYSNQNCAGYLYCQNGVEKSSGYCAAGSYFDEMAGACIVGQQPTYGCCNPAYFGTSSTTESGPPAATTEAQPEVTTVQPGVTTVQPGVTTVQPEVTTVQPEVTTVKP